MQHPVHVGGGGRGINLVLIPSFVPITYIELFVNFLLITCHLQTTEDDPIPIKVLTFADLSLSHCNNTKAA